MRGLFAPLALLALWQALTSLQALPPFVLPSPLAVLRCLVAEAPLLAEHGAVTLAEVAAGLVLGTLLGAVLAATMQLLPPIRSLVEPFLALTQAVPVFVLAPVLTIWLGYGPGPKIAMTVLLVFFPVTQSLLQGMDDTPEASLDLARIAGATPWRAMIWLRLPHALPSLRAGLAIAATYAPTGAVIGEWIGASKGLGFLMLRANAKLQTDLMFAALVLVVLLTLALRRLVLTLGPRDAQAPGLAAPSC